MREVMKGCKFKSILMKMEQWGKFLWQEANLREGILVVLICACQLGALQFSTTGMREWLFLKSEVLLLLNLGIVAVPTFVLILIFSKKYIACIITSIITTVWGVVNYYVILFHGKPFSASVLRNTRTALAVMSGYKLNLDKKVFVVLGFLVLECLIIVFLAKIEKTHPSKSRWIFRSTVLICDSLILWILLFSSWAIKPRSTIGWSWTEPINNYGYACYLLEDIENVINPIKKPENYNVEKLDMCVGGGMRMLRNCLNSQILF